MRKVTTQQLKELWFTFWAEKGYSKINGSSLVPENDATVLFTTAGMHPLVPYLLGEKHPAGTKLFNAQKCVRTNDIDEVGDSGHCTFFEMLGNWTLGKCNKEEMIKCSFEFLTDEKWLGIDKDILAVSVFEGDEIAPRDTVAYNAWLACGLKEEQIFYLPKENNWWALGGGTGPCGPDTEMFIDRGTPKCCDSCSPACDCGKYLEIWNDVFMQYNVPSTDATAEKLEKPNIDTGMGLERTVCILNNVKSVYDIGVFKLAIEKLQEFSFAKYENNDEKTCRAYRIIADHLRAGVMILSDGVVPKNTAQGYILRRLIRRAINQARVLQISDVASVFEKVAKIYIDYYKTDYENVKTTENIILSELNKEIVKFNRTIHDGYKEFEKAIQNATGTLEGAAAFRLYDTYGFPIELTIEMAKERGISVDKDGFDAAFQKHQEKSRAGAEQLFKGGLADTSERTTHLHTATHLLLAALNKVFGGGIFQRGSNITPERLRFDFNFDRKLTDEELNAVEAEVNKNIKAAIPVVCEQMPIEKAKASGAMGVFENKYGEIVKVYTIEGVSKEMCGGPHANNTADLKSFKILKEESSSSGVRRIKGTIE